MTKILVVDDSKVDQGLISGIIKQSTDWAVEFAASGKAALETIGQERPDVVLTDLRMPEMDGLELVAHIRQDFPGLPVVLVTSQGSEDLAIKALRDGATSYTPKRLLGENLVETLRGIISASSRISNRKRVMTNVIDGSISWELENDCSLVVPFIEQIQSFVADWAELDQLRLGMAVDEALINAMYHGNLEVDSKLRDGNDAKFYELANQRRKHPEFAGRRVHITAQFSPDRFSIVIRDEGRGYDPSSLPDPTSPENLDRISGRGLLLIRSFMDQVTFNPTGNEISMIKHRPGYNNNLPG